MSGRAAYTPHTGSCEASALGREALLVVEVEIGNDVSYACGVLFPPYVESAIGSAVAASGDGACDDGVPCMETAIVLCIRHLACFWGSTVKTGGVGFEMENQVPLAAED